MVFTSRYYLSQKFLISLGDKKKEGGGHSISIELQTIFCGGRWSLVSREPLSAIGSGSGVTTGGPRPRHELDACPAEKLPAHTQAGQGRTQYLLLDNFPVNLHWRDWSCSMWNGYSYLRLYVNHGFNCKNNISYEQIFGGKEKSHTDKKDCITSPSAPSPPYTLHHWAVWPGCRAVVRGRLQTTTRTRHLEGGPEVSLGAWRVWRAREWGCDETLETWRVWRKGRSRGREGQKRHWRHWGTEEKEEPKGGSGSKVK